MDLTAPFRPEVFRPIITLIVPGAIASGPFVLVAGHYIPHVDTFWTHHPNAFAVVLTFIVLAVGFVIDDLGTNIEVRTWDRILARRNSTHDEQWNNYLKLQLNDELVGQRYLRAKFTQLKFELATGIALPIAWVGVTWLNVIYRLWGVRETYLVTLAAAVGALYLLFESWQTAGVLARTRGLILQAVNEGIKGVTPQKGSSPRLAVSPSRWAHHR